MSTNFLEFSTNSRAISAEPTDEWRKYYALRTGRAELLGPDDIDADDLIAKVRAGKDACELIDIDNDEYETLRGIIAEGERAKCDLFEANVDMVLNFANRYKGRGVTFADLVQEANMGLMHAINTYDNNKPGQFSSWAYGKITQYVVRSFFSQSLQGAVSRKEGEKLSKFSKIRKKVAEELGREPSVEELVEATGETEDEVRTLSNYGNDHVSFAIPIGNGGEQITLGDTLNERAEKQPENIVIRDSLEQVLSNVISDLSFEEQIVIRGMYGLDDGEVKNLTQLRSILKLPYSTIKELCIQAEESLRQHKDIEELREYLN